MARCPDELTCDFAQYYNIYDIRTLRPSMAAVLASGLEENSRIQKKLAGSRANPELIMLARILDGVIWLQWSKTKDAEKGRNRPEPITELILGIKKPGITGFTSGEEFEEARRRILENTNG